MKVIVTEGQIKSIVRHMMTEGLALNEISTTDAYNRFYSDGKNFIHQDIYNSLMNGTDTMTPFHKALLDMFLQRKVGANTLALAGDTWRSVSPEAKQYLVNMVSNDRERLTANNGMMVYFLTKVRQMKSHTENSFYSRGLEVLFENEGVRVTTTKSYTASAKEYGASHWCTASDRYGEYDGFDMFMRYSTDRSFLVQFICKKDINESFQVQYRSFDNAFDSDTVCDWEDNQRDISDVKDMLRNFGGVSYKYIVKQYIYPNANRIIAEIKENLDDESEYYNRQHRIKLRKALERANQVLSDKNLTAYVADTIGNEIRKYFEERAQIRRWYVYNDSVSIQPLIKSIKDVESGLSNYFIIVGEYSGEGWFRNYLSVRRDEDDAELLSKVSCSWVMDKNYNIVRKLNAVPNEGPWGNLCLFDAPDGNKLINLTNGAVIDTNLFDVEFTKDEKGRICLVAYKDQEPEKFYDCETGEQIDKIETPEMDSIVNYFSEIPKELCIYNKMSSYGRYDIRYVYRVNDTDLIVPSKYCPGPIIRKLIGDGWGEAVRASFVKNGTSIKIDTFQTSFDYLHRDVKNYIKSIANVESDYDDVDIVDIKIERVAGAES